MHGLQGLKLHAVARQEGDDALNTKCQASGLWPTDWRAHRAGGEEAAEGGGRGTGKGSDHGGELENVWSQGPLICAPSGNLTCSVRLRLYGPWAPPIPGTKERSMRAF